MDLVTDSQQRRLVVLERVTSAEPVQASDLRSELVATAARLLRGLTAVGLLLATVLGVLWLLV